jgi:putative ABC transport system ATP-binding protein
MALMLALNQEQGTTLVLVTHDRGIAARCSRVFTMEAGRLRESAQADLEGTATAAAG